MGTASLVFGLMIIGAGIYVANGLWGFQQNEVDQFVFFLFGFAIVPVPLFVIGGLLLRKYDRDRKKEKNS